MNPIPPVPPHDFGAEESLLGAALLAPERLTELVGWIRAEDFYDTRHSAIFGAMLALHEDRSRADTVMVLGKLGNAEMRAYLESLVMRVPSDYGLPDYARRVKDKAVTRGVLHAATALSCAAYDPATRGSDLVAEGKRLLDAVEDGADTAFMSMPELADAAIAACENPTAGTVGTGTDTLDRSCGRLRPGQLVLVGARPGAGKTALALGMCVSAARKGVRAILASYEMHPTDLWVRMACSEAGIPMQEVLEGRCREELKAARGNLDGLPLHVAHAPRMTLPRLFAGCRRARAGLVVVDYLQLVPMPPADTRERQVAEASRLCKLAAQELGVPVVVCVQLNRGVEHRGDDAKPRLSDLRESGALEQDADIVVLLDREELRKQGTARTGVIDANIAKNRNGPTGRVVLGWHGPTMRIYDAT